MASNYSSYSTPYSASYYNQAYHHHHHHPYGSVRHGSSSLNVAPESIRSRSQSYNDLNSLSTYPSSFYYLPQQPQPQQVASPVIPYLGSQQAAAQPKFRPNTAASTASNSMAGGSASVPVTLSRYRGKHARAMSVGSLAEDKNAAAAAVAAAAAAAATASASSTSQLPGHRKQSCNASISSSDISVDTESLLTQTSASSTGSFHSGNLEEDGRVKQIIRGKPTPTIVETTNGVPDSPLQELRLFEFPESDADHIDQTLFTRPVPRRMQNEERPISTVHEIPGVPIENKPIKKSEETIREVKVPTEEPVHAELEPVREPVREPVSEPVSEPVPIATAEPDKESVRESIRESVREPAREPVREYLEPTPVANLEPVVEPAANPATETFSEPVQERPPVSVPEPKPSPKSTAKTGPVLKKVPPVNTDSLVLPSELRQQEPPLRSPSPPQQSAQSANTRPPAQAPFRGITLTDPAPRIPQSPLTSSGFMNRSYATSSNRNSINSMPALRTDEPVTMRHRRSVSDINVGTVPPSPSVKSSRSFGSKLKDLFSSKRRSSSNDTESDTRSVMSSKSNFSIKSSSSMMSISSSIWRRKKSPDRSASSSSSTSSSHLSTPSTPRQTQQPVKSFEVSGHTNRLSSSGSSGGSISSSRSISSSSNNNNAFQPRSATAASPLSGVRGTPTNRMSMQPQPHVSRRPEFAAPRPPSPALKSSVARFNSPVSPPPDDDDDNDTTTTTIPLPKPASYHKSTEVAPPNLTAGDIFPKNLGSENVETIVNSVERTGSFKRQPSTKRRTAEEVVPNALEIEVEKPVKVAPNPKLPSALKSSSGKSVRRRSGANRGPSVSFASQILVYKTYSAQSYDRTPDRMTCDLLSRPGVAQRLREELNQWKLLMEVHPASVSNTQYFQT